MGMGWGVWVWGAGWDVWGVGCRVWDGVCGCGVWGVGGVGVGSEFGCRGSGCKCGDGMGISRGWVGLI